MKKCRKKLYFLKELINYILLLDYNNHRTVDFRGISTIALNSVKKLAIRACRQRTVEFLAKTIEVLSAMPSVEF